MMKRPSCLMILLILLLLAVPGLTEDRPAVVKNVNELTAAIDAGKEASGFSADAYTPYVFVMEEEGKLLVHPTLAGENLKDKAYPIYEALVKATPEGIWVEYIWKGKEKRTFAKRSKGNLIIASGYYLPR